jgi:hypothetical protein
VTVKGRLWQPTAVAFGVFVTAALVRACGSSSSGSPTRVSVSKPLLTACTQLDKQPAETASSHGWTHFYDTPPSLAIVLQHSGNVSLQRLGRALVMPETDPNAAFRFPRRKTRASLSAVHSARIYPGAEYRAVDESRAF